MWCPEEIMYLFSHCQFVNICVASCHGHHWVLFCFLRCLLVICFICTSVYMSIPVTQFTSSPPTFFFFSFCHFIAVLFYISLLLRFNFVVISFSHSPPPHKLLVLILSQFLYIKLRSLIKFINSVCYLFVRAFYIF